MKMLITGGAGFIGTNAAIYFHKLGFHIAIVDNFSRVGVEHNVNYLKNKIKSLKIIQSDIQDTGTYRKELVQSDVILHLAGQTAVTTSVQKPLHDFENNLLAGIKLIESIRSHNPKTIVLYASTNKVYGDLRHHHYQKDKKSAQYLDISSPQGINENEPLSFISPYGCSKGALDQYFLDYARTFNIPTVVFRQSCVYGPFQHGIEDQGWVAHLARQALRKQTVTVFGDGYQVRDLLFVNDLLSAYEAVIKNISSSRGKAFNIGGGLSNAYSLLNVIELLEQVLSRKIKIQFQAARKGDQLSFISANTALKEMSGWQPATSFHEGIKHLLSWQQSFCFAD
jgi:CDP-paratose 2-epimerase